MQMKEKIRHLLQQAEEYREGSLEGRARVTARLAVAESLRLYYTFLNKTLPTGSAFDLINATAVDDSLPANIRDLLVHFIEKVDTSYHLPGNFDLIADARQIFQWVINKTNEMGENK